MAQKEKNKQGGFTLVEILVVLAITGLLTAGMFNFMIAQSRSYNLQTDIQEMEQNARVALEFFSKELQKANYIEIYDIGDDGNRDDNKIPILGIDESNDNTIQDDEKYYFKFRTGDDAASDLLSERIGRSTTNIASFIQDVDGDDVPDIPIFRVEDPTQPNVVTITIVSRTRHRDPRYTLNDGYRTKTLSRHILLRNMS